MRRLWKAAAAAAALGVLAGCETTGGYSRGYGYYDYDPYPYRGAIYVHDGSYWDGRPDRPNRPDRPVRPGGRPGGAVTLPARPSRPPGRPHGGGGRRR